MQIFRRLIINLFRVNDGKADRLIFRVDLLQYGEQRLRYAQRVALLLNDASEVGVAGKPLVGQEEKRAVGQGKKRVAAAEVGQQSLERKRPLADLHLALHIKPVACCFGAYRDVAADQRERFALYFWGNDLKTSGFEGDAVGSEEGEEWEYASAPGPHPKHPPVFHQSHFCQKSHFFGL